MEHKKTMKSVFACASIVLATCALVGVIKLDGIRMELRRANELKSKELDLKIVQTDLALHRYIMDTARFESYRDAR